MHLNRFHLTAFYLSGAFFQLSKRVAGLRYIYTRRLDANRPGYQVLGVLMAIQLSIMSLLWLRDVFLTWYRRPPPVPAAAPVGHRLDGGAIPVREVVSAASTCDHIGSDLALSLISLSFFLAFFLSLSFSLSFSLSLSLSFFLSLFLTFSLSRSLLFLLFLSLSLSLSLSFFLSFSLSLSLSLSLSRHRVHALACVYARVCMYVCVCVCVCVCPRSSHLLLSQTQNKTRMRTRTRTTKVAHHVLCAPCVSVDDVLLRQPNVVTSTVGRVWPSGATRSPSVRCVVPPCR
jgi:hypothetical protein